MSKNINFIKFALGLEYDGSSYHGWQIQNSEVLSIQLEVEKAIASVANHEVQVMCAGRTDSKVHSIGQVVHFKTTSIRSNISWILGINHYLPNDISVKWIKKVCNTFHARYSATARCYRYIIYNDLFRSSILYNKVNHVHHALCVKKMCQAGKMIIGEHDFSSFQSSSCQSYTSYRKIINVQVLRLKKFIFIDIKADSFLQYMVRNIVGCLIDIGRMKYHPEWILEVLKKKNRFFCSPTAIPSGLYLLSIDYPKYFKIPSFDI